MGCNGYITDFFTERFSLRERDSSHRSLQLGRNKQDKMHPVGMERSVKTTQKRINASQRDAPIEQQQTQQI